MTSAFKRIFFQSVILVFLTSQSLYAGWNEEFDVESRLLVERLPEIDTPDYFQNFFYFVKARDDLLRDSSLRKQIQKVNLGKKLMVKKESKNLIVKKRRNNHVHDLYAWELSYLLNGSEFVLPAFPMEIGGKRVIVQKMESFEFGSKTFGKGYSKGTLKKVSLEDYWKAHFLAYILGFSDLAAQNIGVNSKGQIRFFDNEASFIYYNTPFKNEVSFTTGFLCESYEWPQYRQPLDEKVASTLRDFVESFSDFEDFLSIYLASRPLVIELEGLLYRLEKIRSFFIEEGATFRDFFGFVYPKMSPGLDELNRIVSAIYKREVDHGSSLFFVCGRMKRYKLTDKERGKIKRWVETYIE